MAGAQWFNNEDFWSAFETMLFPEDRIEQAVQEVDAVLKLAGTLSGAHVLDLCCGKGRHSLELARRGYHVVGVDRTRLYLAQAQEVATNQNLDVEFVEEDMREYRRPNAFNLALNLFTSFGFFDDPADNNRVLRHVFESLRPGGKLVMDLMGKEVLARIYKPRMWHELPDGRLMLERPVIEPGWRRVHSTWILVDDHGKTEHTMHLWVYSGAELTDMLIQAGFSKVSLFGNLQGAPYDAEAQRLVVVANRA